MDLILAPWRIGRKVGRTIYAVMGEGDDQDPLIGVMDTPALAQQAVDGHNAALKTVAS